MASSTPSQRDSARPSGSRRGAVRLPRRNPTASRRRSSSREALDVYLGELAGAPPLTREQEVALAKRIEKAEVDAFAAVCKIGAALPELAHLAERLDAGELEARRVFSPDTPDPGVAVETLRAVAALETRCAEIDGRLAELAQTKRPKSAGTRLRDERATNRDERDALLEGLDLHREQRHVIVRRVASTLETLAETDLAIAKRGDKSSDAQRARRAARKRRQGIEHVLGASAAALRKHRRALLAAQRRCDRAKSELTTANLRLVVAFAKKYAGRGVSVSDLIQEGNIGLLRAVEKFDHRAGTKFSTYASWWLRQSMQRAIVYQGRTVRLPVHVAAARATAARATQRLAHQLGRDPRTDEIARELQLPTARVRATLEAGRGEVSLEAPLGDDGRLRLGDVVAADEDGPEEEAERGDDREAALEVLQTLSAREQRVIRLRFGIGVSRAHTLREIGEQLGLTRERIRQIEAAALKKMKRVAVTTIR